MPASSATVSQNRGNEFDPLVDTQAPGVIASAARPTRKIGALGKIVAGRPLQARVSRQARAANAACTSSGSSIRRNQDAG